MMLDMCETLFLFRFPADPQLIPYEKTDPQKVKLQALFACRVLNWLGIMVRTMPSLGTAQVTEHKSKSMLTKEVSVA